MLELVLTFVCTHFSAIAQQNLEKYGLANLEKQRAIQQQIESLNQQTKSKSTSAISTNPLAHYEANDHKLNDFLRYI